MSEKEQRRILWAETVLQHRG